MTTPAQQLANYAQTTLAVGCTAGATTLTLTSVAGLPTSGNFMLRIDDVAPATTFEYVEVTSVNVGASQVTCTRGQEGTTGIAHNAGAFVGNDLTAAMLQRSFGMGILAGGLARVVANQGTFTALTDITGLTVTVTLLAGRNYRLLCKVGYGSTISADQVQTSIFDVTASAYVDQTNMTCPTANAVEYRQLMAIVSPGAGSRTYKVNASRITGTGNITMFASATSAATLTIEDVGPA